MSFACLAQAHRHRTIDYSISKGTELGAPLGFYIPLILEDEGKLKKEWVNDLEEVASYDFPQAQLLKVSEKGGIEDFRSKCILRLCGHAQHEIMQNTLRTVKKYIDSVPKIKKWATPKCVQDIKCNEPCVWGSKKALERII